MYEGDWGDITASVWIDNTNCEGDPVIVDGKVWILAQYFGVGSWTLEMYLELGGGYSDMDLAFSNLGHISPDDCEPDEETINNDLACALGEIPGNCGDLSGVNNICGIPGGKSGHVVFCGGASTFTAPAP